jgi:hypothetical protein
MSAATRGRHSQALCQQLKRCEINYLNKKPKSENRGIIAGVGNICRISVPFLRGGFGRWRAPLPPHLQLSSHAKAGDPVFQRQRWFAEKPRRTGYPACAGYDERSVLRSIVGWVEPKAKPIGQLPPDMPKEDGFRYALPILHTSDRSLSLAAPRLDGTSAQSRPCNSAGRLAWGRRRRRGRDGRRNGGNALRSAPCRRCGLPSCRLRCRAA